MNEDQNLDPAIAGLDLTNLRRKLAEEHDWSDDTLDRLEHQYRRFLHLKLLHPHTDLVPTRAIDQIWHAHILDTQAYARDCQAVFGAFLHHYPYLGVGGEQEKARLDDAFQATAQLWHDAYGTEYQQLPGEDGRVAAASRCTGHACHAPTSCACRTPGACK